MVDSNRDLEGNIKLDGFDAEDPQNEEVKNDYGFQPESADGTGRSAAG